MQKYCEKLRLMLKLKKGDKDIQVQRITKDIEEGCVLAQIKL